MDDLYLPKTGVKLSDEVIRKLGKGDVVIASFSLDSIQDIRCEETADYPFPLVLMAVFVALAVVARQYISSPGLGWATAIVCAGIALFSVLGIYGRKIVLETDTGTVAYPVVDTVEEAEGFVISVRQRLNRTA